MIPESIIKIDRKSPRSVMFRSLLSNNTINLLIVSLIIILGYKL
jgi:hypothetical protein